MKLNDITTNNKINNQSSNKIKNYINNKKGKVATTTTIIAKLQQQQ